jgi:heme/copper-type cytochrome/quinol oxidase subunit 2
MRKFLTGPWRPLAATSATLLLVAVAIYGAVVRATVTGPVRDDPTEFGVLLTGACAGTLLGVAGTFVLAVLMFRPRTNGASGSPPRTE